MFRKFCRRPRTFLSLAALGATTLTAASGLQAQGFSYQIHPLPTASEHAWGVALNDFGDAVTDEDHGAADVTFLCLWGAASGVSVGGNTASVPPELSACGVDDYRRVLAYTLGKFRELHWPPFRQRGAALPRDGRCCRGGAGDFDCRAGERP